MCQYKNFTANVSVGRLTENEGDTDIKRFTADIAIKCMDCGCPMLFVGVPGGVNPNHPTSNFDASELRTPIVPADKLKDKSNLVN